MDAAFLNQSIFTRHMPPEDPWLFEKDIPYYYGGHLGHAALAKLSGARPEATFNLAVATVFALCCLLAFTIGSELTRRLRWGLVSLCAVALMGNGYVLREGWRYWRDMNPAKQFRVDPWEASRINRWRVAGSCGPTAWRSSMVQTSRLESSSSCEHRKSTICHGRS